MDARLLADRFVSGLQAFYRLALNVWVTSGFAEASERLRRHPLFVPVSIGCLLFLSLVVGGVSSDEGLSRSFRLVNLSTYERSHSWWAMFLAYAAILALTLAKEGWANRGRLTLALVFVLVITRVQLGIAEESPLAYLSLRESGDLFGYLLIAVALWRYGRTYPAGAALIFALSLGGILLGRWGIGEDRSLLRPDLFPLLYSLPLAISAAIDARTNLRGSGAGPRPEPRPGFHYLGLLVGGVMGGILQHIESYREGASQAFDALGGLWSQSVIAGLGFGPLMRMVRVYTEPLVIAEPRWMGWTGMLATGGVALLLVLVFVSALLTWREIHARVEHRAAALGSQFSIGLIIAGGPNSMLPLLLLFAWTGLALSVPPLIDARERRAVIRPGRYDYARRAAFAIVLLFLAGDVLGFRKPFAASVILNEISNEQGETPETLHALEKAARLNPESPLPSLIHAAWKREVLGQSSRWDEALFRKICRDYEKAMALDPYEPTIPLRLAEVQGIAKRTDAALQTMAEALQRTPGSLELMSWVYFHATSHNRMDSAKAMIDRRLMLEPEALHWWRDRFQFEQDAGRGSRARVALNVALTATVGTGSKAEQDLVRIAFARAETMP